MMRGFLSVLDTESFTNDFNKTDHLSKPEQEIKISDRIG